MKTLLTLPLLFFWLVACFASPEETIIYLTDLKEIPSGKQGYMEGHKAGLAAKPLARQLLRNDPNLVGQTTPEEVAQFLLETPLPPLARAEDLQKAWATRNTPSPLPISLRFSGPQGGPLDPNHLSLQERAPHGLQWVNTHTAFSQGYHKGWRQIMELLLEEESKKK